MNSPPSGDEDLHIVQRDKPLPRLFESATSEEQGTAVPVVSVDSTPRPPSSGRFTFVASLLLIALAFSIGLSYFFEKRWSEGAAGIRANGAAATAFEGVPVPLGPDAFHVSAISLDGQHLAIVNGKGVSEGDSLVVVTSSGPVTAHVTKIEDGVVHFDAGGEKIDAKVNSTLTQKRSP
jgi:hypothetical protein